MPRGAVWSQRSERSLAGRHLLPAELAGSQACRHLGPASDAGRRWLTATTIHGPVRSVEFHQPSGQVFVREALIPQQRPHRLDEEDESVDAFVYVGYAEIRGHGVGRAGRASEGSCLRRRLLTHHVPPHEVEHRITVLRCLPVARSFELRFYEPVTRRYQVSTPR